MQLVVQHFPGIIVQPAFKRFLLQWHQNLSCIAKPAKVHKFLEGVFLHFAAYEHVDIIILLNQVYMYSVKL